ncbi:MAG: type IV secretion system DNA-binding domain-containing protein, partial [Alphaproteobacteria bacterium]|nr:type IV secretion system DNA-binding domain-containing protein [Alphaproteobacteria bacterium]
MTIQSLPFTQGGQTQLHKFRMLRQVSLSTVRMVLVIAVLTFVLWFWLNTSDLNDLFMLPAWGLAVFLEQTPGMPVFLRRCSFFIEEGHFRQCTSNWFMNSPYCYQMVNYVTYHAKNALFAAGGMSVLTSVLTVVYFLRKGKELKETKLVSGFNLVTAKQYIKLLKKLKLRTGLTLDTLALPFEAEVKHMMITGTTGSGKTNAFNHLLNSIRARGDRAVIVDTTGGFVSHFYNEETDKLLNPFDKRSQKWCFWSECPNPETDFDEMAEALIPEGRGNDSFWSRAGRQSFSACAATLAKKQSYSLELLLKTLLQLELSDVSKFLKETNVSSYFSKEAEKTAILIRATLASHIKSLEALEDVSPSEADAFSINRWIKEDGNGFLFLHSKPKQRAYLKPLLSAWFSMAVKALMDLQPDPKRRIWFIVDELASLNQLSGLDTALAEARKYGGCFVVGFQNLSQIEEIYNPTMAKVLSDLTVSKLIFETVDPMNARKLSETLGEQEVIESSENVSFGANEIRDGVSFSHQKRFQPLIRPSDIMQLKPLSCYAKIANVNVVFKHEFGYLDLPIIAADFQEKDKKENIVLKESVLEEDIDENKTDISQAPKLRLVKNECRHESAISVNEYSELHSENKETTSRAVEQNSPLITSFEKEEEEEERNEEYTHATDVFDPVENETNSLPNDHVYGFD